MFLFPVPKGSNTNGADSDAYFMLVLQNQQKSTILTYLEDYKRNPLNANPYLVLTFFDELITSKNLALLRGDVISHMSRLEGATIMEQVLQSYLVDSEYETVRQFNHEPSSFDFETYTKRSIQRFRQIHQELVDREKAIEQQKGEAHGKKSPFLGA